MLDEIIPKTLIIEAITNSIPIGAYNACAFLFYDHHNGN